MNLKQVTITVLENIVWVIYTEVPSNEFRSLYNEWIDSVTNTKQLNINNLCHFFNDKGYVTMDDKLFQSLKAFF